MTADLHTVHLEGSYARPAGEAVSIVLGLDANEAAALAAPEVQLRLLRRRPRHRVLATASVTDSDRGPVLRATVPSSGLRRGVYRIAVRQGDAGSFVRAQARLVVTRAGQPLALLPGPAPRTVMEPPARRATKASDRPVGGRATENGAHLALGRRSVEAAERYGRQLREVTRNILPGR